MNFILYSDVNDRSIRQKIGLPQCSYYFLFRAFLPLFESLGRVHVVSALDEVDPLYQQLLAAGEGCLFVPFMALHNVPGDLQCPAINVVAWEFGSIPNEPWGDNPQQDWTLTLAREGRVIALSSHCAQAIRRAMGADFPVLVLPPPLPEHLINLCRQSPHQPVNPGSSLDVTGGIFDSRALALSAESLIPPPPLTAEQLAEIEALRPPPLTLKRRGVIAKHYLRLWALNQGAAQAVPVSRTHFLRLWYWEGIRDLVPEGLHAWLANTVPAVAGALEVDAPASRAYPDTSTRVESHVDGVVYVSVFNPTDGRKNWHQLLTAFCWAFRDTEDATLVLKFIHSELPCYYDDVMTVLAQLSPFACRVLVVHGYMDEPQYARLCASASFYVNASRGEGLCLPLMEYMACGKPVIAPTHTAMQDYVDEKVAFVVAASEEPTHWPEDERFLNLTRCYRPDWGSLKNAYLDSYRMAKERPQDYQRMSDAAVQRMHDYCALPLLQQRFMDFLGQAAPARRTTTVTDNTPC